MNSERKELLKELAVYIVFALILFLFYRTLWAYILLPPAIIIYHRKNKAVRMQKRMDELNSQFRDFLTALKAALRAGFSVENALKESLNEVVQIYGKNALICQELRMALNKISLNMPPEDALDEMAQSSGSEDISIFASVFRIAKRSGGNLIEIIEKSADDISAKVDVHNEIQVLISSKKLEQTLMLLMPLAMILYIDITSPHMLDPLYGNITGVVIMTVALGIYALSFFLSGKIMHIKI